MEGTHQQEVGVSLVEVLFEEKGDLPLEALLALRVSLGRQH
jgi:hypothetical protein